MRAGRFFVKLTAETAGSPPLLARTFCHGRRHNHELLSGQTSNWDMIEPGKLQGRD
jgi:hypothetical protein